MARMYAFARRPVPRPETTDGELADLLGHAVDIAHQAGELVLEVYGRLAAVRAKADDSPVTEADERAEQPIVTALSAIDADVPIVAEEAVAAGRDEAGRLLAEVLSGCRRRRRRITAFGRTMEWDTAAGHVPSLGGCSATGSLGSRTRTSSPTGRRRSAGIAMALFGVATRMLLTA
jgi:hypothetical protein